MMKKMILMLSSLFFSDSAMADSVPPVLRQPASVSFDATAAGSAVEFHLQAGETANYTSIIELWKLPDAPYDALEKFGQAAPGKNSLQVLRLPVHLLITRLSDGKIFTDKTLDSEDLMGSANKRLDFSVDKVRLERGEYKVQLHVLHGIDRLEGVEIKFSIFIRRL